MRFSNRKEAAVSYLDQAIGAFIQRLEATGITDNTLIVFLSDESHGVTGQPYSRNWGLAAAYTPESDGRINPAVFGLIDIPYSILDYLDLTGVLHSFPKRSIFREQHTERSILFDSYFCEKKGVVERYLDRNRVEIIRSANGELFSNSYDREIVAGQRGKIRDLKATYSQTGPEGGNPAILRLAPTHDLHIDFTRLYPYC